MNKLAIRLIALFVILGVIAGIGGLWWMDATSPADLQNTTSQVFTVSSGEGVRSIAIRLKAQSLIKDQVGFFVLVKLLRLDNQLQAGNFRLAPVMDVQSIIKELTHGTLDTWVTTLEGWRSEEVAFKLAQDIEIPETEFLKYAREGYMFPDTYLFPKDASASGVVKILLDNFEKRITQDIRTAIVKQGISFEDGIILASIVEREGKSDTDRPVIAGILLKRLKEEWPLQADATLQYVLGYQSKDKTWWKKELTDEDKEINSPYNLYKHQGLPPAPISNPGLAAIKAVAYPKESKYWYYIHDKEGKVHFATTLEEHNTNVAKYLQ